MRLSRCRLSSLLAAATLIPSCPGPATAAPIQFLGRGAIAGTASDGLRFSPALLEDGTPHDRIGGFGSAIAYTGSGQRYLAIPDRGPAGGTTSYRDRYYLLDIELGVGPLAPLAIHLVRAAPLVDESSRPFVGHDPARVTSAGKADRALAFDPEGVRVNDRGRFIVCDEYGPFLYEFSPDPPLGATGTVAAPTPAGSARRVRVLPVPDRFLPGRARRTGAAKGRQANRGFEGLALRPDGARLYALLQSPLLQDHARDANDRPEGVNVRILELDLRSRSHRELVYPLDDPVLGLSEMLAIDQQRFLVIERDGARGLEAAVKRVYEIDISQATDVRASATLPARELPAGVAPVSKRLFLDLLDPAFGLAGPDFPEKVEGLAFGPDLPDGRHLLIVSADNDFVASAENLVFAFAIEPTALGGLQHPAYLPESRQTSPSR